MSPSFHVLRIGLVGLAILGVVSGATSGGAQSVTAEETVRSVRRVLERLPCKSPNGNEIRGVTQLQRRRLRRRR